MSKTNWPEPSMMLVTSSWAQTPSFSLIPINNDCPFVEALYNPVEKLLAVIGKTKKDTFHMVPRLDSNGQPEKSPKGTPEDPHKKQRVTQESYAEYYIVDKKETEAFIKNMTINHSTFNYKKVMDMKTMDNPNNSGILQGPPIEKGETKIITLDKK